MPYPVSSRYRALLLVIAMATFIFLHFIIVTRYGSINYFISIQLMSMSAVTSYDTSFRAGGISRPLSLSTSSLVFLMLVISVW